MIATVIWSLGAVLIFLLNHYHVTGYIGIRFTQDIVGFPIDGGWLCVVVAIYCLIRFFVRRAKKKKEAEQNPQ